jgi:hypothetical protein
MTRFVELLKSSLAEKLILLLAAAGVTGLLVPEISSQLSEQRFREQKIFEAELQRQRDVLSAQSGLLRELSKLLWEFILNNIGVSYYSQWEDLSQYDKAVAKYHDRTGDIVGQIRAQMSVARPLVKDHTYKKLEQLYFETILLTDLTLELTINVQKDPDSFNLGIWPEQFRLELKALFEQYGLEPKVMNDSRARLPWLWKTQHRLSFGPDARGLGGAQEKIDVFLSELAEEFRLTPFALRQ